MRKLLLALALCAFATPALAQNKTCPDRPNGDSTNACANTRFVQQNKGGGGGGTPPGGSNKQIQYNNSGAFGGANIFYWDLATSRAGLGTQLPQSLLHIIGGTSGEQYPLRLQIIENGQTSQSVGMQYCAEGTDGSNTKCKGAVSYQSTGTNGRGRWCVDQNSANDTTNALLANAAFCIQNDGSICSAITFDSGGNFVCGILAKIAHCASDPAINDAPGIQALIDSFPASGGTVIFPYSANCFLQGPIIIRNFIRLIGQGSMEGPSRLGGNNAARPALIAQANLGAMIQQASYTTFIRSIMIKDLTLDGNKGAFSVTDMVLLSAIESQMINVSLSNGSGNGLHWPANPDAAWINLFDGLSIGAMNGVGFIFNGSDSRIVNGYFSGNQGGNLDVGSCAGVQIIGNDIEGPTSAVLGLKIRTPNPGEGTACVVSGNWFPINGTAIQLVKATSGVIQVAITGNVFESFNQDILADNNITNVGITGNQFIGTPGLAHIVFGGAGNTAWNITGNVYQSTPYFALPAAYTYTTTNIAGCNIIFTFGIRTGGSC